MQPPVNTSFHACDHYFGQTPFSSVEEAWFWFVQSYDALHSGARIRSGFSKIIRPCEPVDIYAIAMRLFKQGFLNKSHMRVLAQYGETLIPPNPRYYEQERDCDVWNQAMDKLRTPMIRKGIIIGDKAS
jgi:hypothetical protein